MVVLHKVHLALKLRVEVVLALREAVALFLHRRAVALLFVAEAIASQVVLAQTVVKGALSMGWVVHETQTAGVVRNVRVSAATIVNINHWLGVDMGQRLSWALERCHETS